MDNNIDHTVGYGRPPKAHQFQRGKSGNPKGRPKTPKKLPHISHILMRALGQRVSVILNGKESSTTCYDAIIMQLVRKAAQGDMRALRVLMLIIEKYMPMEPALELEDKEKLVASAIAKLMGRIPGDNAAPTAHSAPD